jgi:hypothetical protein
MIGGGIGTLVGSGSKAGVEIGAALRMRTGIVESGRAGTVGRGAKLGRGNTVGSGTRLPIGATSGGTLMVGSGSADAIAGRTGAGASVGATGAATSGALVAPVHATDAIKAKTISRRTPHIPASERASNGPADRRQP